MSSNRVQFAPVEGAAELFTDEFKRYLLFLHDEFTPRISELREKRAEVLNRALHRGILPTHLPASEATTSNWQAAPLPDQLKKPGIEISGPASVTGMFINALNPEPHAGRAEGDLDDDEDSAGHRFIDTIRAARNRKLAVEGTLEYYDPEKDRHYKLEPGELPFFMHRERGLHLDELEVRIDDSLAPAAILGTALTLSYAGKAQAQRGQGIYFYLPKLESAEECAFWRDFFDSSRDFLPHLKNAVIKAIPLIESLPAAYQMEEMLCALGPYGAGLNAARWDFQASILEFVLNDPASVWPDRYGIDIKTTDFLANIFRRLVAICLKRGALPIGGMATALPSRDEEVNRLAAEAIRKDKEWEARQGFIRGWVAHIFHMHTAAAPFQEIRASGWEPAPEMANPANYPVEIKVPEGPITIHATRRNVRTLLEYVEGWLRGRGAKGIDSLAGRPGHHPALMEDLATARISVAQTAQRIRHNAADTESGRKHDLTLVKTLLQEELESILTLLAKEETDLAAYREAKERYRKALKIAGRWIKNYSELNFRSLGSYTRADLERIASEPDAF